ncbi:immunity 22 family protein [Paraglaciecola aquimarina]|uniref:Immunity 22 family protein n=1 Tax=Paraglaciecola algarum TaxID=3050085 RepID=A0ABS9D8K9_9ALTE|nr:immunity 22 family protein [Paraglaciecola sp. G1-23]MCF2948722.1 immunity 22 family protein [Paraglaciecola sp. G1-23]
MPENTRSTNKALLFDKKNKVSIWVSDTPYADIPDEYFEESFFKKNKRAKNTWSDNYNLAYFLPENMETNGSHDGLIDIQTAAGQCSCSSSFMVNLLSKAKKNKLENISWIILVFELEYSTKLSGVTNDYFTTFLGAFNYDPMSESLLGDE